MNKTFNGAVCPECDLEYTFSKSGPLDLRVKRERKYNLEFEIQTPQVTEMDFSFEPLAINPKPEVDFSRIIVPRNLTKQVLSYFTEAESPNSLMLDLGCGGGIHKSVCEHAGFEWVGLDYNSSESSILGDAHSIPFSTSTFEFILSIAVLEHIKFPVVMMREVSRVLKPQGIFIGTVAFLEPFHGDSYYHHTHLGIYNSLLFGGFKIKKIAPNKKWSVLKAQASMALFPHMPQLLSQSIVLPIQLLHKLWWRAIDLIACSNHENIRITNTAGAFTFIATK